MAKVVERKIADLKINFYVRTRLDDDHTMYLWDLMSHGTELPPIVIDQHDSVVEGRHRIAAHELEGLTTIKCVVKHFDSQAHAIAYALASNVGGNLPPSKADIDHAIKLMLAEGLSGRAIVDMVASISPFPVKLIADHVGEVRRQLKRLAVDRAVRAVANGGVTLEEAAADNKVNVEDVKAKLSRSKDEGVDNPHDWKIIKTSLSSTARGVSRTFGGAAAKAIEGYNNGAVDEEHVQSVLDETERLLKKMLKKNRDHRARFTTLATSVNPKWKPKKRRDEKPATKQDPPEETEEDSEVESGVSAVLKKMRLT